MKKYISNVIIFSVGAVLGAGVVEYFIKKNYEDQIQEYSDDLYSKRKKTVPTVSESMAEEIIEEVVDPAEYEHPVDDEEEVQRHIPNVHLRKDPYFIDDFEYREECKTFDKVSLMLFQDLALIDDSDELLHLETIFGQLTNEVTDMFSLDTVYVRNESISTDYEVVKSAKLYSEMYQ